MEQFVLTNNCEIVKYCASILFTNIIPRFKEHITNTYVGKRLLTKSCEDIIIDALSMFLTIHDFNVDILHDYIPLTNIKIENSFGEDQSISIPDVPNVFIRCIGLSNDESNIPKILMQKFASILIRLHTETKELAKKIIDELCIGHFTGFIAYELQDALKFYIDISSHCNELYFRF